MTGVSLERVVKQYPNGVVAVRELSLDVSPGELLALVGPSGCGKTTTLRLIAGLEEPTSGRVCLNGHDVRGVPPRRRNLALVFQRPALYPHLSVRDNLAFGLRLRQGLWPWRKRGEIDARVRETADLLGLGDVLGRRPDQLSGGQQQRVALGRAVVRRAPLWLLDEPLASLDAPLRAELRGELHLLRRRLGATMILVTHDQADALALGDRVAVLAEGELQQAGSPRDVYEHPANRFVAGFLGWPPMNLIDGELRDEGGRTWFRGGAWSVPLPDDARTNVAPGGQVTLGVRPEHVRVAPGDERIPALAMRVGRVEPLGFADLLTLERDGLTLRALGDGRTMTEGTNVRVSVDQDRIHLFAGRPAG